MRWLGVLATLLAARAAYADGDCRSVSVDLVPSDKLQIVAWIETADGAYVDTAFITQTTGRYGLGNRPGVMGTKSNWHWPYGPRLDVFPVWAHRHGHVFPWVAWQQGDGIPGGYSDPDNELNAAFSKSSQEPFYCHPMLPNDGHADAETCASTVFTDKGKLIASLPSVYPPRADIAHHAQGDSSDVDQYAAIDVFDAVSRATPVGGAPFSIAWATPPELAAGDYRMFVEVSREDDFNASYTPDTYPVPPGPYSDYGSPYRGQPSVVYSVPFTIGASASTAASMDYVGYSDLDGVLHPPDATISTDTPGSGASRLELVADASGMYRVRVTATPETDDLAPAAPAQLAVAHVDTSSAELSFIAPGDDGLAGTATGYDIRYMLGDSLDAQTFATATHAATSPAPLPGGTPQTIVLAGLAAGQTYTVGVRAYDNCGHTGPLAIARVATDSPEVAACGGCASGSAGAGGMLGVLLLVLRRRRR